MAMIPLKCPSCGADIILDDSREFGFCQFCGTQIQNDAIRKLKIEYSGDPMSVTHINNTTNVTVDNRKTGMFVAKPKIGRAIVGVFLLLCGMVFLSITIGQSNSSGLIFVIPCFAIGALCIMSFINAALSIRTPY